MFRTVRDNGYMVEQTTQGAISPSTGRTLPDRYIEGTCPICGYGEARGDQCDNCGNQLDATDLIDPRSKINGETPEFIETQHYLLDLPGARRRAARVARRAGGVRHLAAERDPVQQEHPRRHPPARDDARHRLGHPGAGLGGPADQAALRLVRRRRRVPVGHGRVGPPAGDAGALARLVERPRRPGLLLHGQGQHRLPLPDLAGRAARVQRPGLARRRAGDVRRAQPAHRGGRRRSSSRWATSSSRPAAGTCSTSATSSSGTARTRCATTSAPPARRPPTPTSPGPSSSPATTPSWWRAGATWSTARPRWCRRASARSRPPARSSRSTSDVIAAVRAGFASVGGLIGRHRLRAGIAEAMRVVGEVNKYLTATEPYKMKDESQRERLGDGAARGRAVRQRLQPAARAVPAARHQRGAPGAGRRGRPRPDAASSSRSTSSTRARAPGSPPTR